MPFCAVSLAAIAYLTFNVLLLSSGGGADFQAGLLFTMNLPVFTLWIIALVRNHRRSHLLGFSAAGLQSLIYGVMFLADIGDKTIVFMINGGIFLVLCLLTGLTWMLARSRAGQHGDQAGAEVEAIADDS